MHSRRSRLGRLRRLPWRRRLLLAEAVLNLAASWLAIHALPYRWLIKGFRRPLRGPQVRGEGRTYRVNEVRWAVDAASRGLPWRMKCFPRAVAAWWMLRRRGIPTVLYYGGATTAERGLTTHVWLQDGSHGVVGVAQAQGLAVLARYTAADEVK
jgi:hypothetical protein